MYKCLHILYRVSCGGVISALQCVACAATIVYSFLLSEHYVTAFAQCVPCESGNTCIFLRFLPTRAVYVAGKHNCLCTLEHCCLRCIHLRNMLICILFIVSAVGTQQVQLQNAEGSSQAGEFLINKLSLHFTDICRKLACFFLHFH
jgi:hypothetical protein